MALIASKRKATQSVDVSGIFIWFRAMTVCVRLFDCALYLFVDFLVGATSCSVYIHLKCSEDSYSCHSKTLRPHLSILKWHLLHWPGAFRVAPFFSRSRFHSLFFIITFVRLQMPKHFSRLFSVEWECSVSSKRAKETERTVLACHALLFPCQHLRFHLIYTCFSIWLKRRRFSHWFAQLDWSIGKHLRPIQIGLN